MQVKKYFESPSETVFQDEIIPGAQGNADYFVSVPIQPLLSFSKVIY